VVERHLAKVNVARSNRVTRLFSFNTLMIKGLLKPDVFCNDDDLTSLIRQHAKN
jgi:hypothetical protein